MIATIAYTIAIILGCAVLAWLISEYRRVARHAQLERFIYHRMRQLRIKQLYHMEEEIISGEQLPRSSIDQWLEECRDEDARHGIASYTTMRK